MRMGKAMGLWLCALVAAIVGLGGVARAADTELRGQVAPGQHGGEERTFAQKVQIGQLTQTAEIVLTAAFKFLHVATLSADDSAFWNPARFADERLKATMDATLAAPHDGGFRQRTAGALATGAGGEGDNTFSFASRIDAADVEALVVLVEWTPDKQWRELPRNGKMMPGTDKDKRKYRITATCGAAGKYEMAVFYAGKEVKTFALKQGESTYPANGGELILDTFKDPGHGKAEVKIRKKGASDGFLPGAYPFWVGNEALIVRMDRHVGEAVPKGLGKGGAWEALPRHGNVQVAKNHDTGRYEIHDKIKVTLDVPAPTNGDDDQGYELVVVHNGDVKERIAGIGAGDGQEFAIETAKLAREDGNVQPGQGFARLFHGEEQIDEYPFWVSRECERVALKLGNGGYLLMTPKNGGKDPKYVPAKREKLSLEYFPEELTKGTLVLSAQAGGGKIKVFDQEEGGKELRLPQRWPAADKGAIPSALYVEGAQLSDAEGDVELRWEYVNEYGESVAEAGVATVCAVAITALESHRANPGAWNELDGATLVIPEGKLGNDKYRCQLTMKPTIKDAEIRVACEGTEVDKAEVAKGKETYELDPKKFDDQKFFEKEATLYVRKKGDDEIKLTEDKKFHVWPVVQLELKAKKGLLRLDKNQNGARPTALTKDNHTEVALQVAPNGRVKSGKVTLDFVGGKSVIELRDSLNPGANIIAPPVSWDVGGNGGAMPNIIQAVASKDGVAKLSLTYDNGHGYKGEPRSASMKDAENEAVALENIMVADLKLMYQKVKADVATPWQIVEDYNDDGEYEIFIRYYDDIKTKEEAVNGIETSPLRVNLKLDGAPDTMEVVWPEGVVTSRGTKGRAARCYFANACEMDVTPVVKGSGVNIPLIVYVVKVEYEKNDGTVYGFDSPTPRHIRNDYDTYISLPRDGKNCFDLRVEPELKKFNIMIKPIDVDDNKIKLTNANVAINQALYCPAVKKMPVVIEGLNFRNRRDSGIVCADIEVAIANDDGEELAKLVDPLEVNAAGDAISSNRFIICLFKQVSFNVNLINFSSKRMYINGGSQTPDSICIDKDGLNSAFNQFVYNVDSVDGENSLATQWDKNGDGILVKYAGPITEINNPEWFSLLRPYVRRSNPVFFVDDFVYCCRATIRATILRDGQTLVVFSLNSGKLTPDSPRYNLMDAYNYDLQKKWPASTERFDGGKWRVSRTDRRGNPNDQGGFYTVALSHNDVLRLQFSGVSPIAGRSLLLVDCSALGQTFLAPRSAQRQRLNRPIVIKVDGFLSTIENVVIHELGHSVAGLKDTRSNSPFGEDVTLMQWNRGTVPIPYRFSARAVEEVQTGTGASFSPRQFVRQWMEALR